MLHDSLPANTQHYMFCSHVFYHVPVHSGTTAQQFHLQDARKHTFRYAPGPPSHKSIQKLTKAICLACVPLHPFGRVAHLAAVAHLEFESGWASPSSAGGSIMCCYVPAHVPLRSVTGCHFWFWDAAAAAAGGAGLGPHSWAGACMGLERDRIKYCPMRESQTKCVNPVVSFPNRMSCMRSTTFQANPSLAPA